MGLSPLRHGSLFTGAGGGEYAAKLLGWQTRFYVEREPYCQRVIQARIADGTFDDAPIWDDVTTFDGKPWRGRVDVITAGFPCQPFSVAGKRAAADDERNGWPDTIRIIREVRPRYALLENVPGLLSGSHGYFGTILSDLAQSGYDASWCVLSAARLGAPHIRKRLWILATDSQRIDVRIKRGAGPGRKALGQGAPVAGDDGQAGIVTDANGSGRIKQRRPIPTSSEIHSTKRSSAEAPFDGPWGARPPEPVLRGMDARLANRRDRLKALGNGQVSIVAATAWRLLGGP